MPTGKTHNLIGLFAHIVIASCQATVPTRGATQVPADRLTDAPPTRARTPPPPSPSPTGTPSPTVAPTQQLMLQLTYMLQEPGDQVGLYAVTLGCPTRIPPCLGDPELLFTIEAISDLSFAKHSWSPDGSQVAYSIDALGWGRSLFLGDSSGDAIATVIDAKDHGPALRPAWSGSGNEIAYYTCRGSACSIMIWDLEQDEASAVFSGGEIQWAYDPDWSFDGSLLLFSAVEPAGSRQQIFVSERGGDEARQITVGSGNKISPSFSPPGDEIIYIQYPTDWDGVGKLMSANADGSNPVVVASEWLTGFSGPTWSPIADWIAYNKMFDIDGWDLYISKPDGSNEIRITESPEVVKGLPAWRYAR